MCPAEAVPVSDSMRTPLSKSHLRQRPIQPRSHGVRFHREGSKENVASKCVVALTNVVGPEGGTGGVACERVSSKAATGPSAARR